MRKNIAMICVTLAAVIASQGCINHEIRLDSFEELCIASGGTPAKKVDVCTCGNDPACPAGVICSKYNEEYFCASTLPSGVCDNYKGQTRCYGQNYVECVSNETGQYVWSEPKNCSTETGSPVSCMNMNSCGVCLNSDKKCETSNEISQTYTCVSGKWEYTATCNPGSGCKENSENKGECGECLNGSIKCENDGNDIAVLYKCSDGVFEKNNDVCGDVSCTSSFETDNGCGECKNGAIQCTKGVDADEPARTELCVNGKWGKIISYCETGFCAANNTCGCDYKDGNNIICENNSEDIAVLKKCSENGIFETADETINTCGNVSCSATYGETGWCGECKNGEIRCTSENGSARTEICTNGKWGTTLSYCETGFCSANNTCGCDYKDGNNIICENNSKDIAVLKKCSENGVFETVDETINPCGNVSCSGTYGETGWCGECKNGETRCTSENGPARTEICTNGRWGTTLSYCETGFCSANNTCGCDYKDGNNIICENNSKDIAVLKKCSENGIFETADETINSCGNVSCSSNYEDNSWCGECINGNTQCKDGFIQTCINGTWSTGTQCETLKCFDASVCLVCSEGEYKCDNNKKYSCDISNNTWSDSGGVCNAEEKCSFGETKCVCLDYECSVQTCNHYGFWMLSYECNDGFLCKDHNHCGECKENSFQCLENEKSIGKLKQCLNGKYLPEITCPNNSSCQSNSQCGECLNGKFKNVSTDIKRCSLIPCVNGLWDESQKKDYSLSCKYDPENQYATVGECIEGTIYCTDNGGKKLHKCLNGEMIIKPCSEICDASNGTCY